MTEKEAFNIFKKTGKIDDYLEYKKIKDKKSE